MEDDNKHIVARLSMLLEHMLKFSSDDYMKWEIFSPAIIQQIFKGYVLQGGFNELPDQLKQSMINENG